MGESEIKYYISKGLFRYVSKIFCFHVKSIHGVKIEEVHKILSLSIWFRNLLEHTVS